jgi:hypothetical protein
VNIFEKHAILRLYFNFDSFNYLINKDLDFYLYANLDEENYILLRWDLKNALIDNINGKYI